MQYTNTLNLPAPIVSAITNDEYSRGDSDITVTELIDAPRKVALTRLHGEKLVEDVSDRIYSLMGNAVHGILEKSAGAESSVEDRIYADFERPLGRWKLGGKYDLLALVDDPEYGRILSDYKNVSVFELINGLKPEKAQQLNILGWLARKNGYRVDRLEAVCILRDWSKGRARRDHEYPQHQVMRYFVPTWSDEKTVEFIRERIDLHQQAQLGELPECSDEERWYKGTKYALMKEGRKSAIRLLDSYDAAFAHADLKGFTEEKNEIVVLKKGYSIVERPGENTRCLDYCAVGSSGFCEQWNALRAASPEQEEEPGDE